MWKKFIRENRSMVRELVRDVKTGGESSCARYTIYRCVTRDMYGQLSKGDRRRLPDCVGNNVKKMFPSEDGNYTGYKQG